MIGISVVAGAVGGLMGGYVGACFEELEVAVEAETSSICSETLSSHVAEIVEEAESVVSVGTDDSLQKTESMMEIFSDS